MLLAVPNLSEGRDRLVIKTIAESVRGDPYLDLHSDPTHNRSVLTIAGESGVLGWKLIDVATAAVETIDMRVHKGAHPCIGAVDVCPLVYVTPEDRGDAQAEALAVANGIAEQLEVPVFLYGDLASSPERRERAFFRRGGLGELTRRMAEGELKPDRGPDAPHRTAGATLVTARPPLAAFNIELDTPDREIATAVAVELRESGGGLPGVRAIGVELPGGRSQVSTNVHDVVAVPLARVVDEIRRLAEPHGARPVEAEVVGLVPEAAVEGYPADVPLRGFDPAQHLIERRVAALD